MRIEHIGKVMTRPHLEMMMTTYFDTKGKRCEWDWVTRPKTKNAVMIAAQHINDGLVLIKEYRVPIQNYEWGFPAGLIEEGEKPEACAVREFKEETGMDLRNIQEVSPVLYNSAGLTDEGVIIVIGEAYGEMSDKGHESSEEIEIHTMGPSRVKELMSEKGVCMGAKAWLLMQNYVKNKGSLWGPIEQ